MGADRAQAVASFDGAGPRILGTFSARYGTPIAVNLLSGIVSTVVMFVATYFSGGNSNAYFGAVLGLAISTTTISYLVVFPALIKLRYSHPDVPRPYRVPFGAVGVWVVGVLTTLWALLASIVLVWPGFGTGWFGTGGNPDDALTSISSAFTHKRMQYELTQIVPLVVLTVVGVIFYALGSETRAHVVEPNRVQSVAPAPMDGDGRALA